MRHNIHKNFPLGELTEGFIYCDLVYSYCKLKKILPIEIEIKNIECNDLSIINDFDVRYRRVDINQPGIALLINDSYRLIDGRHRLKKLMDLKRKTMLCYVLQKENILKFYSLT